MTNPPPPPTVRSRARRLLPLLLLLLTSARAASGEVGHANWAELSRELTEYRAALDRVRKEHGGARSLPPAKFFLFGMGGRAKHVYQSGRLTTATGQVVREWAVAEEMIVPSAYAVALKTTDGRTVVLFEDDRAFGLGEGGRRTIISEGPVRLPDFAGRPHAPVLRVLHQELLVNVIDGKPVPNYFVYAKPWYRDGAMMAMAFQKTENLHLIKEWILGLRDPYDRNNNGEAEADNPGQVLYLASLVSDKNHPIVPLARAELKRLTKGDHVEGRSDFAPHPVYQTQWAKFGLRALGLADPFTAPRVKDDYAPLFWWDVSGVDLSEVKTRPSDDYPYLTWAGDHATGSRLGKLSDRDYPLTWEAKASQANYAGIKSLSPAYAEQKISAPHTWHAAEAFLHLHEAKR